MLPLEQSGDVRHERHVIQVKVKGSILSPSASSSLLLRVFAEICTEKGNRNPTTVPRLQTVEQIWCLFDF